VERSFYVALLGLLLFSATASAADAVIGTWNLNVERSKFSGPAPKSETRVYIASANGFTCDAKEVEASGKESNLHETITYDGKPEQITDTPVFDSLIAKRIDDRTADFTLWKNGKQVGTLRRVVSPNGKTLTMESKVKGTDGKMEKDTLVYDRQ
jgi:hypothetical protein